jgi:hypothetical protein
MSVVDIFVLIQEINILRKCMSMQWVSNIPLACEGGTLVNIIRALTPSRSRSTELTHNPVLLGIFTAPRDWPRKELFD